VIDDDTISSEHAIIGLSEGRYYLEDRRSSNGTRLGEKRLEPGQRIQLKGGDQLRLADIELMFVLAG
jgi:pSer/pThr/pTyr-binding forkhead associated (FHA) protein